MKFSVDTNKLELSTSNADVGGEGREAIDCDYGGQAMEIGYNAAYVLDILSRIEEEEAIFEFSSPVAAGVVYSPGIDKEDFLCLIMPLRLAE